MNNHRIMAHAHTHISTVTNKSSHLYNQKLVSNQFYRIPGK